MPEADLESLLSPLQGDAGPCGADPEYDAVFRALEEAGRGKAEQQFGATVIPAQGPDWPAVGESAEQLALRTRDLRVAVWLVRSGARIGGLAGAVRGFQVLRGLVERHWDQVHPQLDASDNNDPTARMSALSPLVHPRAGLADLRAASLTGQRGSLTLRDIELAIGHAEPVPGEPVPTAEGVLAGVVTALAERPALAAQVQAGLDSVQALQAVVSQRVPATQGVDFAPLLKLMKSGAEAMRRATGQASAAAAEEGAPAAPPRPAGAIASREEAIRTLERVAEWIERNEPTNPAPLLIRRSQRLMTKNFIDIIRDLVPDSVGQIEKLAGGKQ